MKRKPFDRNRLFSALVGTGDQIHLVELATGIPFPSPAVVVARYDDGPQMTMTLEVHDGRPVLKSLTLEATELGPAAITPTVVDELPLGPILDEIVGQQGVTAVALTRAAAAATRGEPHRFLTDDERADAHEAATGSRRGRPVTDRQVRYAAQIARINPWDRRRQVAEQLMVSPRTASRLIAEARRRGYLEDNEGEEDEQP